VGVPIRPHGWCQRSLFPANAKKIFCQTFLIWNESLEVGLERFLRHVFSPQTPANVQQASEFTQLVAIPFFLLLLAQSVCHWHRHAQQTLLTVAGQPSRSFFASKSKDKEHRWFGSLFTTFLPRKSEKMPWKQTVNVQSHVLWLNKSLLPPIPKSLYPSLVAQVPKSLPLPPNKCC